MRRIVFICLISAFALTSCKEDATKKINAENVAEASARDEAAGKFPVMTFEKTEHDFGTINEGDVVETVFKFTNTGDAPLMIVNARGSCGCTVPEWPENQAIAPGQTSQMLVKFNSSGKPNLQNKTVTITANTESGREQIKIKAMVTPDPEKQQKRDEAAAKRKAAQQANSK